MKKYTRLSLTWVEAFKQNALYSSLKKLQTILILKTY